MSANRNKRLAWIAQEITQGKSNPQIIIDMMRTFPGVSEKTAKADLKELLERFSEIDEETIATAKAKYLEIGFKLLQDCRQAAQFGPAVNQFKALAQIAGVMAEGNKNPEGGPNANNGSPENAMIRERIATLIKSKPIKKAAQDAGIDLKELAKEDNG
jgi:hypothetical protein